MKKLFTKSEFYLFLLILALGAIFTIANPKFLAWQNILDLLKSYSFFGIVLGSANGLLIHFLRIPPIITTIATLNLYFGTLYVISTGDIIYRVPQFYQELSGATLPGGVPIVATLWFAVVIVTGLILRYTLLGRSIYALGGNP